MRTKKCVGQCPHCGCETNEDLFAEESKEEGRHRTVEIYCDKCKTHFKEWYSVSYIESSYQDLGD